MAGVPWRGGILRTHIPPHNIQHGGNSWDQQATYMQTKVKMRAAHVVAHITQILINYPDINIWRIMWCLCQWNKVLYNSDITWAICHLKSLPTELFVQQFIQFNNQENNQVTHCRESTSDQWIPLTTGHWARKPFHVMTSRLEKSICRKALNCWSAITGQLISYLSKFLLI